MSQRARKLIRLGNVRDLPGLGRPTSSDLRVRNWRRCSAHCPTERAAADPNIPRRRHESNNIATTRSR